MKTTWIWGMLAVSFGAPLAIWAMPGDVTAAVEAVAEDRSGSLDQLSADLDALVAPMEAKVDDCDGQVQQATQRLMELKVQHQETGEQLNKQIRQIKILGQALQMKGCQVVIGVRSFDRETIAGALSNRLESYQAMAGQFRDLGQEVANQEKVLTEAIAKLERWKAKEKELLEKVQLLDSGHESLLSGQEEVIEDLFSVRSEVTQMLANASKSVKTAEKTEELSEPTEEMDCDEGKDTDGEEASAEDSQATGSEGAEEVETESVESEAVEVDVELTVEQGGGADIVTEVDQILEIDIETQEGSIQ
jgi:septal ring factor EnvC (AmiA/AmiB activator)